MAQVISCLLSFQISVINFFFQSQGIWISTQSFWLVVYFTELKHFGHVVRAILTAVVFHRCWTLAKVLLNNIVELLLLQQVFFFLFVLDLLVLFSRCSSAFDLCQFYFWTA